MSIMHFDAMPAAAAENIVVNLDGDTAGDFDAFLATAGWQFRNNGTVYRRTGSSFFQIDAATDWITPRTGLTPGDYEIRMSHSGSASYKLSVSDSVNVWHSLVSTRRFTWECSRFCVESSTVTFDIRHATDGSKNIVSSLNDGAPCMATSSSYFVTIEAT